MSVFEGLRVARDEVAVLPFDAMTTCEMLGLLDELERDRRRRPAVEHRLIKGRITLLVRDRLHSQ
jgi:hypothetical protein